LADEEGAALGSEINSLRAASQLAPASAESARALA
jgi:hypothetical protein